MSDAHDLSLAQPMGAQECLDLLQKKAKVGRVGFVAHGHPMILPVNYQADDSSVVFRTSEGTSLSLLGGARVAFEVDSYDASTHSGWSVLVHGVAQEVTGTEELTRLRRGRLQSWGRRDVEEGDHWVRIPIEDVTGRRIGEVR
ncbi:MAG: pyridoxamine 5'-phosphate oxidase family protein [Actinomycetota bacterium]